jgi:pyruvate kinase
MKASRAQIVATVGPSSQKVATLHKMILDGMDVARLNFSWGVYDTHAEAVANIREAAKLAGKHVPVIQDLSGPRIQAVQGHHFNQKYAHDITKGVITEKDLRDLDFGATQKFEWVALSYVGNARDVQCLREELKLRNYSAKIIAKIERADAVANLKEIIKASDAIMVARGDLGNEIPLEQIPYVELDIIRAAKKAKKTVITATQMMLSMANNPQPTRAEVTDVAYAIIAGSDAVMLSEESAQGKYPIETISMMEKIIVEAEKHEYRVNVRPL